MTPTRHTPAPEDAAAQADKIVRDACTILAGQHPSVAGAALVQLAAMHLAGFIGSPEQIDKIIANHCRAVRRMTLALQIERDRAERPEKVS